MFFQFQMICLLQRFYIFVSQFVEVEFPFFIDFVHSWHECVSRTMCFKQKKLAIPLNLTYYYMWVTKHERDCVRCTSRPRASSAVNSKTTRHNPSYIFGSIWHPNWKRSYSQWDETHKRQYFPGLKMTRMKKMRAYCFQIIFLPSLSKCCV
jgi:hypothetical protein